MSFTNSLYEYEMATLFPASVSIVVLMCMLVSINSFCAAFIIFLSKSSVMEMSHRSKVYDGIINHKILRMHQIRYVDNVITYDIVWIVTGSLMIIVGYLMSRKREMIKHDNS